MSHLYQWRLGQKHEQPHYLHHLEYVTALKELLGPESSTRTFIELSVDFAHHFTFAGYRIEFPLFPSYEYYPSIADMEDILACLSEGELEQVDMEGVFTTIMSLKELADGALLNSALHCQLAYQQKVRYELYEILLIRLVEVRSLKKALGVAQQLMEMPNDEPVYNVVYPLLILEHVFPELLPPTQALLHRLISYYFPHIDELCAILHRLATERFARAEIDAFLSAKIAEKEGEPIYSRHPTDLPRLAGPAGHETGQPVAGDVRPATDGHKRGLSQQHLHRDSLPDCPLQAFGAGQVDLVPQVGHQHEDLPLVHELHGS